MHALRRFVPIGFFAVFLAVPAWSKPPPNEAEYKRADTSFYLRRDVHLADPGAVILPASSFRQQDDSYFFQPHKKAPHEIYLLEMHDWLEPITPPSMPLAPTDLGITGDTMQIREMQGDVQVALTGDPTNFAAATDKMTIPNSAIVKTGDNGSAAILFGGVNSARLEPDTQVAVRQVITPTIRSTLVDLKAGAVFSKVGLRPGYKQDYEVRTPSGTAKAKGTDFLTIADASHADVFVAQGVVEFDGPDGKRVAEARSNGKGELEIIQSALAASAGKAAPPAVTDELTMALNFIPTVDLKVKALRDRVAGGGKLTPQEKKYLSLLRRLPALIKLTLVAPPAPPPQPPPAPETPKPVAPAAPATMPPQVETTAPVKPVAESTPAPKKKVKKKVVTTSTEESVSTVPAPSRDIEMRAPFPRGRTTRCRELGVPSVILSLSKDQVSIRRQRTISGAGEQRRFLRASRVRATSSPDHLN